MPTSLPTVRAHLRTAATRHRRLSRLIVVGVCVLAPPVAVRAQLARSDEPQLVTSMGQPPQWLPYATGSAVVGGGAAAPGGRLLLGVHRPIGSPIVGFGVDGEAYATVGGTSATSGVRLLGAVRMLGLSAGLDWDARARNSVLALSWATALRRGGIVGTGTMLRADWLPARPRPLALGVTVPLGQPYAGRTRPRRVGVTLPAPGVGGGARTADPGAAIPTPSGSSLATVRGAALLISVYSSFFSEQSGRGLLDTRRGFRSTLEEARDALVVTSAHFPGGRSYEDAIRVYDAQLARAFAIAADSSSAPQAPHAASGAVIAARARAGLLDHVLLPYDTLFGRVKEGPAGIARLTAAAHASFTRWLDDSSGVAVARRPAALAVHARWLGIVEDVHRLLSAQWADSRRVWLPLQLALAPEQYDEQAEVDALLARAAGRPFTGDNAVTFLSSTNLAHEFARSVRLARDYHVLWVHDFTGRRESGAMDRVGYQAVADVYFPALTQAVQRYDTTGRITTFHIFLDQHYYALRDARLWMSVLENPLDAAIHLPAGNDSAETHLRARQQALRDAVARSARLQADAARGGGAPWLRATVKVHVNVTQPSDFSFRSRHIIPPLPFVPDNVMRDHRKIAFYDLTEADPDRGAMVLGGVGIGEHYFSPTWDDRGVVLRGPAAVEVRAAARRLLRRNGVAEAEIPPALREVPGGVAPTPVEPGQPGRSSGVRALQVHNEPGFGRKQSSVARAMLYNLAPRGSVIVVPDPLWISGEWAGMLAGAALRGCRVFVIAPSRANAPNASAIVLAQSADVLSRLLAIGEVFGPELARVGGELRVGVYTATEDVNDVARQSREVRAGAERTPWLRTLIPFDSATLISLDSVGPDLERLGYRAVALGRDLAPRAPQLHAKMQLIAAPEALAAVARQPQWSELIRRGSLARAMQNSAAAAPGGLPAAYEAAQLAAPAVGLALGYDAARSADERRRVSFYMTTGTQNQDTRGLAIDGEATLVVSGEAAVVSLFDFYTFLARSTWITTNAELDRHLPPGGRLTRWLARLARLVL